MKPARVCSLSFDESLDYLIECGFDIGCLTTTTTRMLCLRDRYIISNRDVLAVPRTPLNLLVTENKPIKPKDEYESQVGVLNQLNWVI